MENYPIDFVITWVDEKDKEWFDLRSTMLEKQIGSNKSEKKGIDTRKNRIRDWDNLLYLLRSIDECAPWVNHVFIVTPCKAPTWLNFDYDKVTVIDQRILFPEESVSFNNCAIELLLHRIPNLSEHFVYFNDDMFLLRKTEPDDFFKEGLPCTTVALHPIRFDNYSEKGQDGIGVCGIFFSCTKLIARRFTKEEILKNSKGKFFSLKNGKYLLRTITMLPWPYITGFLEMHTATSFCKRSFEELWNSAYDELARTTTCVFRSDWNLSQWVVEYWQIATGKYSLRRPSFSKFFGVVDRKDADSVAKCIERQKHKIICINDDIKYDFDSISSRINMALEKRFSHKSRFEK